MYRTLNDLRILRLALHMEETFERYEQYLRAGIPYVPIRAKLAPLFNPGAAHKRLERAHAELAEVASRPAESLDAASILQTLSDCERAAHEFYLFYLDRLSSPALVRLFQDLAEEEAAHARIVDEAREMLGSLPQGSGLAARP